MTVTNDGLTTYLMTVQESLCVTASARCLAESFATALKTDGHLVLYLSFDTNRTTLLAESTNSGKAALAAQKIDGPRMESKGFGATRPVADNASEARRAKNRRVELVKL